MLAGNAKINFLTERSVCWGYYGHSLKVNLSSYWRSPELSLNAEIVSQLPQFLFLRCKEAGGDRSLLVHIAMPLLTEPGIDGREVLLLTPAKEGTTVKIVSDIDEVRVLLEAGLTVSEAALPRAKPENAEQLSFL